MSERRVLRIAAFSAAWLATGLAVGQAIAEPRAIEVEARPIDRFRIASDEIRFGPFEFVGGLELVSGSRDFGAVSAFRFLSPGQDFLAVADTGFWLRGAIRREGDRPVGYDAVSIDEMTGPDGQSTREKWYTDAESLAVRDGVATAGFERVHRITDYALTDGTPGRRLRDRDFLVPMRELRGNRGFEALAYAPKEGPLAGALVAITEKSLDGNGDVFAAVLDGPRKGVFTVARIGDFDVTDGAFLPDGDLLLLERRYTMATGVGMRFRRIPVGEIGKGKRAEGTILFEANMAYQIDNMEALDVWIRSDGATMVSLMSDDNHSILQRNLYLEFRLTGD